MTRGRKHPVGAPGIVVRQTITCERAVRIPAPGTARIGSLFPSEAMDSPTPQPNLERAFQEQPCCIGVGTDLLTSICVSEGVFEHKKYG